MVVIPGPGCWPIHTRVLTV